MLGREQIHNPTYSLIEKAYIWLFGMPIVGLRIRARNIFSLIPDSRDFKNILDAGSGSGVFSFELARRFPDAKITGVDPLAETIRQCNFIAEKIAVKNIEFREGLLEELPREQRFDLIISVDMLEHISDDTGILRIMSDLLEEGGLLVLHVPALYRRYPFMKKSLNFDVQTHVRAGYTIQDLTEKTSTAGLQIEKIGYTYGFWETISNNISYMITGASMRNKKVYAMAFPLLMLISMLGYRARPKTLGAGIYLLATRGRQS